MPSEEAAKVSWADAAELPSWADEVEEAEEYASDKPRLPPATESVDGDIKTVVEYKINEDGKKVKVVRTYKIEIKRTSKSVARRKLLPKFGASRDDPPGPNRATTIISEDVGMQFINSRQEEVQDAEDPLLSKFRNQIQYFMFFKNFKTANRAPGDTKEEEEKKQEPAEPQPSSGPSTGGRYVPPSMRAGATGKGSSMPSRTTRDEQATIRVTNLSEETKESDLQDLFRPFGPIQRIYLAKDKHTQQSKGFAFINFYNRDDAAKAIQAISGYGYDHLILNVEWAKPSTPSTGGGS